MCSLYKSWLFQSKKDILVFYSAQHIAKFTNIRAILFNYLVMNKAGREIIAEKNARYWKVHIISSRKFPKFFLIKKFTDIKISKIQDFACGLNFFAIYILQVWGSIYVDWGHCIEER